MKKLTLVGLLLCVFISWIWLGSWVWAQRPKVQVSTNQEAVDAVINLRVTTLEGAVEMHSQLLTQLQADRNWLMGGLAVIGGVGILVQVMQLAATLKRPRG